MAAPATAYRTKSIYARNLANTADIQTMVGILQTDKATMLSRFFLDGLFNVTTEAGIDGIVGYCRIGSSNYNMHHPNRIGNLRLYDGGDCVLFNDAGLNTKGDATVNTFDNGVTVGSISIKADFRSAFYIPTTTYGFKWRNVTMSPNTVNIANIGSLNQNQALSASYPLNTAMGIKAGDQIAFIAFVTNVEGTFDSAEFPMTIKAMIISAKTGAYASTAYSSDATVTIYLGVDDPTLGDMFYSDEAATTNLNTSVYYVFNGLWYKYGFDTFLNRYAILDKGTVGAWPSGDPGNAAQYTTYNWASYDPGTSGYACAIAGGPNAVSTFYKNSTGRHYSDSALTTIAQDGYYTTFMGDYYDWTLIQNGYQVDTGSC